MIEITSSIEIERPADEVFAYVSDFENNPEWQGGMRTARWTSTPPIEAGSTYDQVASFLGREIVTSFQVTALRPGRSVTIESTGGSFPLKITRHVEPLGPDRCRVSAEVAGDPGGFYRIASPVLRWLVRRSVRGDYRRLKRSLEEETSTAEAEDAQ